MSYRGQIFKGISEKSKKWVTGSISECDLAGVFIKNSKGKVERVYRDTVCESTGHRDVFRTNIFEDDLLRFENGIQAVVVYSVEDDGFKLSYNYKHYPLSVLSEKKARVIGNIWDDFKQGE